jgi:CelD/BcsL family acetyltransferase involved in cellulose biosynthesis
MPAMSGDAPSTSLLCSELHGQSLEVACDVRHESPYIALPSSWDGYLAALPSQRRYLVRRSVRDFGRWAGDALRFEVAATPADLERGYSILRTLHEQRWSETAQGGVFRSPRFRAFHERVMPELLERGELELAWLCVRDEPIAALYNIIYDGNVYFYQSGRKTDVPKQIRPGLVMHAYMIRRAIELGRKSYDFLAGASRYKRDLSLASRPLVELRAARSSPLETLRRVVERSVVRARAVRAGWLGAPA